MALDKLVSQSDVRNNTSKWGSSDQGMAEGSLRTSKTLVNLDLHLASTTSILDLILDVLHVQYCAVVG